MWFGFFSNWCLEYVPSVNTAQSKHILKHCGLQTSCRHKEHYSITTRTLNKVLNGIRSCWPKNVKTILPLMKIFVTAVLILLYKLISYWYFDPLSLQ